jgi:hypothetical protein
MADNGFSAQSQFKRLFINRPVQCEINELCVPSVYLQSAIDVTNAYEAILPEFLLSSFMPIKVVVCGSTYLQVIFHVANGHHSCHKH